MKVFEEMDPEKRREMLLEAVASNVSLEEGHEDIAQELLDEAAELRKKRVGTTLDEESDHPETPST